jgi:glyoxylase-like metal-dependent hydrolase (beta-lactamase superfamily II)
LVLRELAPEVVLAVQTSPKGSSANVLAVRMTDGTVVICSSPYDTKTTRVLVRALRARFRATRLVAINTHFHADGTNGNEAYAAEGVETYASDHTVALARERGEAGRETMAKYVEAADPQLAARIRSTALAPAAHTFAEAEGLTLQFGADNVRALFVGAGHSPDNIVVFFPRQRVLFGGCMVRSESGLGNTSDADIAHWADAADAAARLEPVIVIPGHGEVGGPELLRATAERARAATKP